MPKLIAIIVLVAGVLTIGTSKECSEEDLKKCFKDLQQSVTDGSKLDINSYCQSVEKKEKCMTEASESCKKDHPEISSLISAFHAYISHMCTGYGEDFIEMNTCLEDHRKEVEKCERTGMSDPENPFVEICYSVDELQCQVKLSKKVCKNSEAFVKVMEERVRILKKAVCSSTNGLYYSKASGINGSFLGYSSWIISLMMIILFSYKSKF